MLGAVPGVTAGAEMLGLLSPQSPQSLVVVVPSPWGLKPGLVECLDRLEWLDCWLMLTICNSTGQGDEMETQIRFLLQLGGLST